MFTMTDASLRAHRTGVLMRALASLLVAAVVVASLYPLSAWRAPAAGAFAFLGAGLPRYWTGFDVATNVLAYALLALLATLGWAARLAPAVAFSAVTAAGALLSLLLEAAQGYLPARVPSLLDWLANTGGTVAGAWLGAMLNRAAHRSGRLGPPVTERWYEQGPASGWVLLLLWLAAQLVPQRLMFGTGHVEPALQRLLDRLGPLDAPDLSRLIDRLWSGAAPPGVGVAIEAAVVICAVCAVGSLAFALVHGSRRRLVLVIGIATIAIGLRSIASQMVYGAGAPLAWLTPGVQGGAVVGALLLYALDTFGPRARAACAAAAALLGMLLVNVAPSDGYFATTLSGTSAGQWANLHGLLRIASVLWPMLAIVWFGRRALARTTAG
jgi:VanZ family protein